MSFVRNAWYAAALPAEIGDSPLARTLLGDPVVLFRGLDGKAHALLDICPHRFARLSMGEICEGLIQCPYHGLKFSGSGRCVHNPHGNGATPASLNVKSFPLVEKDDLVWIWMGASEEAREDDIPDFSCRVDPKRKTIGGVAEVECNYKLLVDNLMDLGHAQFVHRANAEMDNFHKVRRKVRAEAGEIWNEMMFPCGTPNVFASKLFGGTNQLIDSWTDVRWNPVSSLMNFIGFAPEGTPRSESMNAMGTHIVTPLDEGRSHYFYAASRNYFLNDGEMDTHIRAWQAQALMREDKPMVEAIQELMPIVESHGLKPAMLACDEAAVRVSREIERLEKLNEKNA